MSRYPELPGGTGEHAAARHTRFAAEGHARPGAYHPETGRSPACGRDRTGGLAYDLEYALHDWDDLASDHSLVPEWRYPASPRAGGAPRRFLR